MVWWVGDLCGSVRYGFRLQILLRISVVVAAVSPAAILPPEIWKTPFYLRHRNQTHRHVEIFSAKVVQLWISSDVPNLKLV